jgi:neutral ceramidase
MPATRQLKLQAIRIGDLGIAAIPCEVYGSTGLAIKAASPFGTTMNISLANGAEGYLAPPEQHKLGGYTTWRARTSCLEELAEPKIKAAVVGLLSKTQE